MVELEYKLLDEVGLAKPCKSVSQPAVGPWWSYELAALQNPEFQNRACQRLKIITKKKYTTRN